MDFHKTVPGPLRMNSNNLQTSSGFPSNTSWRPCVSCEWVLLTLLMSAFTLVIYLPLLWSLGPERARTPALFGTGGSAPAGWGTYRNMKMLHKHWLSTRRVRGFKCQTLCPLEPWITRDSFGIFIPGDTFQIKASWRVGSQIAERSNSRMFKQCGF